MLKWLSFTLLVCCCCWNKGTFTQTIAVWKGQLRIDTNFSKTHLSFLGRYINEQHSHIWTLSLTGHFISYHTTNLWKYLPCLLQCLKCWSESRPKVGLYMWAYMDGTLPMHWPGWRDASLDLEAIAEFSWFQLSWKGRHYLNVVLWWCGCMKLGLQLGIWEEVFTCLSLLVWCLSENKWSTWESNWGLVSLAQTVFATRAATLLSSHHTVTETSHLQSETPQQDIFCPALLLHNPSIWGRNESLQPASSSKHFKLSLIFT